MERTIEKSRTGSANWPACVALPARGGSYYSSRPVTSGELIISTLDRGNAFLPEQLAVRRVRACSLAPLDWFRSAQSLDLVQDIGSHAGPGKVMVSSAECGQHNRVDLISSAPRYGSIPARKRDPSPREGIAKEVGMRAGAARVTPPEACHG
jgi:hypothetical protein